MPADDSPENITPQLSLPQNLLLTSHLSRKGQSQTMYEHVGEVSPTQTQYAAEHSASRDDIADERRSLKLERYKRKRGKSKRRKTEKKKEKGRSGGKKQKRTIETDWAREKERDRTMWNGGAGEKKQKKRS